MNFFDRIHMVIPVGFIAAALIMGPSPAEPEGGGVVFERTRLIRSGDAGALSWPLPDLPPGTERYRIQINAFADPLVLGAEPPTTNFHGGVFTVNTATANHRLTVGGSALVDEGLQLDMSALSTATYEAYPDAPDDLVRFEWDTVDLTLFGGLGAVESWTVTFRIVAE